MEMANFEFQGVNHHDLNALFKLILIKLHACEQYEIKHLNQNQNGACGGSA